MMTKRIMALLLTLALTIGAITPAMAALPTVSEGVGTVHNPIINVTVPLALNFAVDPLNLQDTAIGQLRNHQYGIINRSNVAVGVGVHLSLVVPSAAPNIVTLVDREVGAGSTVAGNTNPTDAVKRLHFSVLGANTAVFGTTTPPITATWDATDDDGLNREFGADTELHQSLGFILSPIATGTAQPFPSTAAAPHANGVAAFRFHALMNPFAAWETGDIEVRGAIQVVPVNRATAVVLTGMTDDKSEDDTGIGHRIMSSVLQDEFLPRTNAVNGLSGFGSPGFVPLRSTSQSIPHFPTGAPGSPAAINIPFILASVPTTATLDRVENAAGMTIDGITIADNNLTVNPARAAVLRATAVGGTPTWNVFLKGEATPYVIRWTITAAE